MMDWLRNLLDYRHLRSAWPALAALNCEINDELRRLQRAPFCQSLVFREEAILRLHAMQQQFADLAAGRLRFDSTETWRTIYEQVLKDCRLKRYLSVALIRSEDYWRDAPGQNSLDLNYKLIEQGFHIQRVFIIDEFFWSRHASTPSSDIFQPIVTQSQRGIEVSLVRMTSLDDEPSLHCDMGIYGELAVGVQETDFQGKTLKFELRFASADIRQAERRWRQVELFATSISDL